jgi:hypothetical protein
LFWLPGKRCPDHETMAEFRRRNTEAFKERVQGVCETVRKTGVIGERISGNRREQVQGGKQQRAELYRLCAKRNKLLG